MLTRWAEDVWTESRPMRFFGVETGTRMTIVRLSGGGLFVVSPVALDAQTKAEVDALGTVAAVVAPSLFHHLAVGAWMDAYPRATFAACPGLEWKRPDLPFSTVLGDTAADAWRGEIEQVYFSARRENEVDFYHPKSKTLIVTDALLNLSTHPSRSTRLVARVMGNSGPGLGWLEPVMVRDRRVARRQVDRMMEWDFERIILAHGDTIASGGKAVLARAYDWL